MKRNTQIADNNGDVQFKPVDLIVATLLDAYLVQAIRCVSHIAGEMEGLLQHLPMVVDPFDDRFLRSFRG